MAFAKEIGHPRKGGGDGGKSLGGEHVLVGLPGQGQRAHEGHPECGGFLSTWQRNLRDKSWAQTVLAKWNIWKRGTDSAPHKHGHLFFTPKASETYRNL